LWKYGTLLLRARQLGLVEAAHRLLSLALYDCSVNIEFLNTNPIDQRVKTLLPKKDLEKLEENAPIKNLFTLNFIDDYYPNRPPALENFCLFNIYSNFVYVIGNNFLQTLVILLALDMRSLLNAWELKQEQKLR
jgi:hypothetical protein